MASNSVNAPAVLIVEDEPLVRLCAVETVEDAGFEVIEAANAGDAILTLGAGSVSQLGERILEELQANAKAA